MDGERRISGCNAILLSYIINAVALGYISVTYTFGHSVMGMNVFLVVAAWFVFQVLLLFVIFF